MKMRNTLNSLLLAGLLLGSNVASAATVIFELGTDRAIEIQNLQVDSTLYNVAFDPQATAETVYGSFPGTYTFTTFDSAAAARDSINAALNADDAGAIGEPGVDIDFGSFNVGYEGQSLGQLDFVNTHRGVMEDQTNDWVTLGQNQWSYTLDEKNYATFTPAVIPVPAAVWLFGSALGLLGWIRRIKK